MPSKVKVRLAPSPTGFLHVGTAQSALYNWLFACQQGGSFLLRIEDTDKGRSTKEFENSILEALKWLGLDWDGEIAYQSERTAEYRAALEKLLAEGKAFYCHHTKEDLEAEGKRQESAKEAPRHICEHKNTEKGKESGGIIRLVVDSSNDQEHILFEDMIRGAITFKMALLGDFSIARSLDEPLYNFAVVVDDIDMKISHVIRGEDHISNTPKQEMIRGMLTDMPIKYAHLPLILAPDRSKLSKRHGATAVVDYKKDYLPEALINFLGTLSYTFSKEIISKEEMIGEFDLTKVHKSGAVFDVKKLNWINSQYVKKLSAEEFKLVSGLPELPDSAVPLITERLEKLSDVAGFDYLWKQPEYDGDLLKWKKGDLEQSKESLEKVLEIMKTISFTDNELRAGLDKLGEELDNRGLAYWPLRVALSGKDKSPDPVQIALVIGKEETLRRINAAIKKIS